MDTIKPPATLQEAIRYFADPERCLVFMVDLRWSSGVACPTCDSREVKYLGSRRLWKCKTKHPRQQFSAKVGTVFEDSPISLAKWLPAVWLLANCKNGISSYELARDLGVTQKTAWFMLQRLRLAMQVDGTLEKISGSGSIVEVDETWIGGKARLMNAKRRRKVSKTDKTEHKARGPYAISGKAIVFGMLERGGRVRTLMVPNTGRATLLPELAKRVQRGSEIHTDEHSAYGGLAARYYEHKVVNHAVTYVSGNVHTNSMENFWSLLKRAIRGTYVSVEPFHLFRYLDEQSFRFNLRKHKDKDGGRFVEALRGIVGKRLTYKGLIGQAAPATT
jgi:transposase-like protein